MDINGECMFTFGFDATQDVEPVAHNMIECADMFDTGMLGLELYERLAYGITRELVTALRPVFTTATGTVTASGFTLSLNDDALMDAVQRAVNDACDSSGLTTLDVHDMCAVTDEPDCLRDDTASVRSQDPGAETFVIPEPVQFTVERSA